MVVRDERGRGGQRGSSVRWGVGGGTGLGWAWASLALHSCGSGTGWAEACTEGCGAGSVQAGVAAPATSSERSLAGAHGAPARAAGASLLSGGRARIGQSEGRREKPARRWPRVRDPPPHARPSRTTRGAPGVLVKGGGGVRVGTWVICKGGRRSFGERIAPAKVMGEP